MKIYVIKVCKYLYEESVQVYLNEMLQVNKVNEVESHNSM